MNSTTCAECGRTFPPDELVRLQNSWVWAACKPIFLQRMLEGAPQPAGGLWRSGKVLVAAREATFPDRCVKCNVPVQGWRLKRNLYWYPPYVIVLVLLSWLIGLIVAMIVRKSARVEIGLCELHRVRRVRGMVIGTVVLISGFVLLIVGFSMDKGWLALVGFVALISGIVVLVKTAPISVKKIDDKFVWINGVCRPFLEMLPEWRQGA